MKCIKGLVDNEIGYECDKNCDYCWTNNYGNNCFAECEKCGGDYIETTEGLICKDCGYEGDIY